MQRVRTTKRAIFWLGLCLGLSGCSDPAPTEAEMTEAVRSALAEVVQNAPSEVKPFRLMSLIALSRHGCDAAGRKMGWNCRFTATLGTGQGIRSYTIEGRFVKVGDRFKLSNS